MGVRVGFVAICVMVALSETGAYKIFQQKLPNGGNVPGVDAIGHERAGGGPNNDFGLDFIEAMFKYTKTFCEKDSDGDGQTNGQELGDPCCEFEFRANEKVRWTEGVSHPGDPELKSDPALWEGIVCGAELVDPGAAVEPEDTAEPKEKTTEDKAKEKAEETTLLAVKETGNQPELTAGAPALHASVMLSAGSLTVMIIYVGVKRWGRRTRNLPIFRRRREPM
ncbi:hypothetical protein V7S43_008627 [Phytophthora oleae]|uniref:Temptin Cys/Cys disulfide domain-containing protein n=1 Tax=Phytophthora oleae TaxID=2107226 RepID=A0ABD3FJA3_9STRA